MSTRITIWCSPDITGEHIYRDITKGAEIDGKWEDSICIDVERKNVDIVYYDELELQIEVKPGNAFYDLLKSLDK